MSTEQILERLMREYGDSVFSYVLSLLKGLSFGRRCHTGNIYESYEKIKRLF
jgi:hypothetical protein